MEEVLLADKYAKALIAVAREANLIERLDKELSMFAQLLEKYTELRQMLLSPIISFREKRELLEVTLEKGRISPELKGFLYLLLKVRRFNLFGEIHRIYKYLIYSLRKRLKAVVETALALDPGQRQALKEKLARIYQRNIDLFVRVNPALIGGAKIYLGHTLFDGTVKTKLELLREQIWKE